MSVPLTPGGPASILMEPSRIVDTTSFDLSDDETEMFATLVTPGVHVLDGMDGLCDLALIGFLLVINGIRNAGIGKLGGVDKWDKDKIVCRYFERWRET